MKKSHLLVGLGISISLLTACQNSSSNTATKEAETTTQTTVAPKPVTDYTLYNSVLKDYKEVVENVTNNNGQKKSNSNNPNVNSTAYSVKRVYDAPGISYTLEDFDKNGVDELVITMGPTREDHATLDIYTISDGKVIRLTNKDNKLDKIGDKSNLYPLEDGTFSYSSTDTANYAHYRLNQKGDAFEIVTEGTTEDIIKNLPPKIDLKQKEWKPTQWYITSPEKQKEVAKKKLDIQAIQNGDYSSLKGTLFYISYHFLKMQNVVKSTFVTFLEFPHNANFTEHLRNTEQKRNKKGAILSSTFYYFYLQRYRVMIS